MDPTAPRHLRSRIVAAVLGVLLGGALAACGTTTAGTAIAGAARPSAGAAPTGGSVPGVDPRTGTPTTDEQPVPGDPGSSESEPTDPGSTDGPVGSADPGGAAGSGSSVAPPGWPLPDVGLDGVNDADCVPTADVPPVLLIHGTFSTASSNYGGLAYPLVETGRCVYAVDYGNQGTDAVGSSATEVAAAARQVLESTGSARLDLVGYSQGGLIVRTMLRDNGLADLVRVAVLIAPTFHGTTAPEVQALAPVCAACADQVAGSELLQRLDAGGDLDGAVRYAVVSSSADTAVTPTASQVPEGPADRVVSIVAEDQCPGLVTDHVAIPADPGVVNWVIAALETGGAPPPQALTCP
ncbi:esterase/lipase family protein [Nakamurella alba]|nr:alpha/beta fold hydrolase [Nakamurella alba]